MPGGHANMPHYGNDSAATSGTGPMMGGASMMGGNAGTTDPAVLGAREIAIRATSDVFSSSEIHVRAGETVTIALSVSSTSPTT